MLSVQTSDFNSTPIFGTLLAGKRLQKADSNSCLDSQTYNGSSQITAIVLFASSCHARNVCNLNKVRACTKKCTWGLGLFFTGIISIAPLNYMQLVTLVLAWNAVKVSVIDRYTYRRLRIQNSRLRVHVQWFFMWASRYFVHSVSTRVLEVRYSCTLASIGLDLAVNLCCLSYSSCSISLLTHLSSIC